MLRKFLYRWRLNRILNDKGLNRRQRCLFILQLLQGEELSKQKFDTRLNLKLKVLYNNIVTYTRKIKEINFCIDRKTLISSDMLSTSPVVIALDSFFTDQDNYYVEVNKSFESFTKECVRLLTLLADADDAEYGYYEHMDRTLTNVLQNLEEVLIKISVGLHS